MLIGFKKFWISWKRVSRIARTFGACIGISIPLAFCLASSINAIDIIVWGSIAVILQLICFKVVDLVLKDLSKRIIDGEVGVSIVLVSFKISIAILNAAALSG